MEKKKFKIIRVTLTTDYLIEMHDEKQSCINGWTIDEIIEDWFNKYSLGGFHVTRDHHKIMSSRKFIKSEVVDIDNEVAM